MSLTKAENTSDHAVWCCKDYVLKDPFPRKHTREYESNSIYQC